LYILAKKRKKSSTCSWT